MAKINPLELFYRNESEDNKNFNFDMMFAPPLFSMIHPVVDQQIMSIVNNLKLNGSPKKKLEMYRDILKPYGFVEFGKGTNRVVYKSIWRDDILLKVAIDKVGAKDGFNELYNQSELKPFVAKTFEVSPSGCISLVERVIPVTHKSEFKEIANDVFDVLVRFIIGKYVLSDIGTDFYMNWGIRKGFGPVLLDYPYMYELDGKKLYCNKMINTPNGMMPCGGLIDYDAGFNHLYCERCGKKYFAADLKSEEAKLQIFSGLGGKKMGIKVYINDQLVTDLGKRFNETKAETVNSIDRSSDNKVTDISSKFDKDTLGKKKLDGDQKKKFWYPKLKYITKSAVDAGIGESDKIRLMLIGTLMGHPNVNFAMTFDDANDFVDVFFTDMNSETKKEAEEKVVQFTSKEEEPKKEKLNHEKVEYMAVNDGKAVLKVHRDKDNNVTLPVVIDGKKQFIAPFTYGTYTKTLGMIQKGTDKDGYMILEYPENYKKNSTVKISLNGEHKEISKEDYSIVTASMGFQPKGKDKEGYIIFEGDKKAFENGLKYFKGEIDKDDSEDASEPEEQTYKVDSPLIPNMDEETASKF